MHYFHGTDGLGPQGLVLGTNGDFYGTTVAGGASTNCPQGCGTIFQITAAGTLFSLHSFSVTDGNYPVSAPVEGWDGNLYGTTEEGGTGCTSGDCGTVYKITATGTFTTLHNFTGTDGSVPFAPLVVGDTGNLYGTTSSGGLYGFGTVFEITPTGILTTLHNFDRTDGAAPLGALVQGKDGNFYGMTGEGGRFNFGTIFFISPGGHLFASLRSFDGTNGGGPLAGLVLGSDGNLYGPTSEGNASASYGTLFEITSGATVTTLHTFDSTDGGRTVMLMQAPNGKFYGTNAGFGANNDCPDSSGCGTAFSLSLGLEPFITIAPAQGWVGRPVRILGYNLTSTTGVAFNDTPATFTVVSDTEISTNVPSGATKGLVTVTTPSGTLTSQAVFFAP